MGRKSRRKLERRLGLVQPTRKEVERARRRPNDAVGTSNQPSKSMNASPPAARRDSLRHS